MTTSVLDDATLAVMRAEAAADRSPFIDPVVFRKASTVLAGVDAAWLERVTGHPARSWRYLSAPEIGLAVRAAEADAGYLKAVEDERLAVLRSEADRRSAAAAAEAKAARDAWEALRARLPVAVRTCHNWTVRHVDGYEQGADHIVVLAGLNAGRLHREEGQPLCWTPSRAHELRHVGANVGDEKRVPDCKACVRRAEKLANRALA